MSKTKPCAFCGTSIPLSPTSKTHCSVECRVKELWRQFDGVEECWEWPLSRNVQHGYGQLSTWKDGKHLILIAHRASYEAAWGEIRDGLRVLHRCDNPACFNPSHLFLGTQADNIADMFSKNRQRDYLATAAKGERHGSRTKPERTLRGINQPKAKLTDDLVREIRASLDSTASLARKYGVSETTVHDVRTGRTWRHVT